MYQQNKVYYSEVLTQQFLNFKQRFCITLMVMACSRVVEKNQVPEKVLLFERYPPPGYVVQERSHGCRPAEAGYRHWVTEPALCQG